MDTSKLRRLISSSLESELLINSIEVFIEDEHKIRIVIVSDSFKGMRFLKRTNFLNAKLLDLMMGEYSDYSFIFNPLTVNEKENEISEVTEGSDAEAPVKIKIASSTDARI